MPMVIVETWPLDEERKPRLIRKITEAFASEGIPAEAVTIVMHESPKQNWGTGGYQHTVRFGE